MSTLDHVFEREVVRRGGKVVVRYELRPEHEEELQRIEAETGTHGIWAIFGELVPRLEARLPRSQRVAHAMERAAPLVDAMLGAGLIDEASAEGARLENETTAILATLNLERSDAGRPLIVVDADDAFSKWTSRAEIFRIVKNRYDGSEYVENLSNQTRFWRHWVEKRSDVEVVHDPDRPHLVRINVAQLSQVFPQLTSRDRDDLFGR